MTEDDIKTLKECYHLYNIVDLRTKNGRNSAPDIEIPGTVYHALDFFQGEDDGQATGSAEQLQQMQSKEQVDRKMKQLYASFVVSAGARQKMYELLQLLLNTEKGSTLIHCFAGKDRTGISAAAILTVLGVSKDDIVADYLKTNQLREKENEELLGELRAAKVLESMLEAVHEALCVRREYLETSYEAAEQKYESFERYILEGIGFGQEKNGCSCGTCIWNEAFSRVGFEHRNNYSNSSAAPFAKPHWRANCGYTASLLIHWRSAHLTASRRILMRA